MMSKEEYIEYWKNISTFKASDFIDWTGDLFLRLTGDRDESR